MNSPRQKSERTLGVICILCSAFCFSLMSVFVRLAGDVPVMQKIFFRNLVAALAAFAILARERKGFRIHKGCLGGHLLRSVTGMIGMVANFWAIDHIGIADANMLNKLSPFFAIIFSIFILREFPKKADILSVLAAFIGAVFVVRPTAGIASLPALVGVLGGLGAGAAYTFVRHLSQKGERGPEIVMFFSAFTCVCSIPFFAFRFQPMSARQWIFLLLAGCAGEGNFGVRLLADRLCRALGLLPLWRASGRAEHSWLRYHHRRGGIPLHLQSARRQKGRRGKELIFRRAYCTDTLSCFTKYFYRFSIILY